MNTNQNQLRKGKHIHFLDNLRTVIIFLVILYHAGGFYEAAGIYDTWWIVDDPATNNLSGILNIILGIFVMPTLFYISGYLAEASLKNKKSWTYIKAKFTRIILPWIIGVLTVIPLYKVIFLFSRNLPQEHWSTYFHFSNGFISQSWLWYLPVLFLFNILYLLFSKLNIRTSNISLKGAVFGAFLIGFVYSVSMDVFGLQGWTLTPLIDFQNERVLIYFMVFLLGALSFNHTVFASEPKSKKLYTIVNSTSWLPVTAYIFFFIFPWFSPGNFIVSEIVDKMILWFSYLLSLLSLVYLMIETFRRYFDKPGKLWNELNQNSYPVYIIHLIVMGIIALIMRDTAIPSILKYLTLTIASYTVCNLIVSFFRSILQPKRFVNK